MKHHDHQTAQSNNKKIEKKLFNVNCMYRAGLDFSCFSSIAFHPFWWYPEADFRYAQCRNSPGTRIGKPKISFLRLPKVDEKQCKEKERKR